MRNKKWNLLTFKMKDSFFIIYYSQRYEYLKKRKSTKRKWDFHHSIVSDNAWYRHLFFASCLTCVKWKSGAKFQLNGHHSLYTFKFMLLWIPWLINRKKKKMQYIVNKRNERLRLNIFFYSLLIINVIIIIIVIKISSDVRSFFF